MLLLTFVRNRSGKCEFVNGVSFLNFYVMYLLNYPITPWAQVFFTDLPESSFDHSPNPNGPTPSIMKFLMAEKRHLSGKGDFFCKFSDFISFTVALFDAHNKPKIPNFFYPKVQCLHLKLTSSVFLKRYYFKSIPKNTTHLLCVTCNAYDVL